MSTASRANAYGVKVESVGFLLDPRAVAVAKTDRKGFDRYTVAWLGTNGLVNRANTVGNMTGLSASIKPGDIVNIIRDGNGCIISIEKAEA